MLACDFLNRCQHIFFAIEAISVVDQRSNGVDRVIGQKSFLNSRYRVVMLDNDPMVKQVLAYFDAKRFDRDDCVS